MTTVGSLLALRVAMVLVVGVVSLACRSGETTTAAANRAMVSPAATTAAATPTPTPTPGSTPTPTPQPTSTPQPTPIPTAVPIETRTMVFTGDVLSHTPVIGQALRYGAEGHDYSKDLAYDYRPMFAELAPRLQRADLAVCVLETPVSADNVGLDGYPTFEAPRELPDALVHAGYDGCSTASNHSMDRGRDGVGVTLDQMDRVGLGHAGMARSEPEALAPRIYDLDGVAVAHLSYSYSLNGFLLPDDAPWLVNLNDVDSIVAEATRARQAGADLVVLSIQWGNEYQREPSDEQITLAQEITNAGVIDLIMGNHVHVVQPVAIVNTIPVVYGLGNSLSNQSDNCCRTGTQDGVLIEATVRGNSENGYQVTGLAFAPTWVDRSNYTVIDLLAALADPSIDPAVRSVYQTSMERTVQAVHSFGWQIPLATNEK